MALFLKRAGLEMTAVSYRGTAPAMTDVIAGHIPTMFVPLPEAMPQAEGGKVRMLAISDDKRSREAPDVPTIAESGYPGYRGISWNGLMAPAGTPKDIVNRIAAEFARAAKDPKFVAQLDKYGVDAARARRRRNSPSSSRRHGAVGGSGEDRRRHSCSSHRA